MNTATMDHARERQDPLGDVGMWIFIATEVLFFGALFTGLLVYRNAYPQSFSEASHKLHFWFGTVNTAVLLTSSLTMALAVAAAKLGRTRAALLSLGATALLGVGFLLIKGYEYHREFTEHLAPWQASADYSFASTDPHHVELFYNFYFAMTGLHALHLLIAIGVVGVVSLKVARRKARAVHTVVEVTGLYWHFVDIVWVFLYPLLYLVGR